MMNARGGGRTQWPPQQQYNTILQVSHVFLTKPQQLVSTSELNGNPPRTFELSHQSIIKPGKIDNYRMKKKMREGGS